VCYYRVEENFRPYDLDPCLCTHVVYSYVAIRDNFAFIAGKKGEESIFRLFPPEFARHSFIRHSSLQGRRALDSCLLKTSSFEAAAERRMQP
jgi:hypothetical protein